MQRESAPVLLCCASCGIEHQSSVHTFLSFLKKNQTLIWIANRFPSLFKVISPKSVYIVTLTVTRFRSAPFFKWSLSLRRTFLVLFEWMWWWACLRRWTLVRRETENNLFSLLIIYLGVMITNESESEICIWSAQWWHTSPHLKGVVQPWSDWKGDVHRVMQVPCAASSSRLFFFLEKFPFVFKRVEQEQMVGNNIGTPASVYIQESLKKKGKRNSYDGKPRAATEVFRRADVYINEASTFPFKLVLWRSQVWFVSYYVAMIKSWVR